MNTEEYNGWTNRETWAVNLWLDNDRALYERVSAMAQNTFEEYEGEPDQNDGLWTLQEAIKDLLDEVFTWSNYNLVSQELLSMRDDIGSLWRVNWREIAEAWLQTAKENEKVGA